eukprot:GHVR01104998.1.p1 GENE.GHVR01104998.1~~GHVR01104998.1.p1  ORF type:complete len:338 (+),score=123.59 GHVR01104998.1:57-1070(+)
MPPKKQEKGGGVDKATDKAKQKIVEDKTFGLKNKNKSKAVQSYIKQVSTNVLQKSSEDTNREKKDKKNELEKQLAFMQSLFKVADNKKKEDAKALTANTTNPEAIKESQKINLYVDQREQKEVADWNVEQLETDIICKHFIDAVEKKTYGWFWVCPNNGNQCKYRHFLPYGYVLKSNDKDDGEEGAEETVEERVERLRCELPVGGTKVTEETFKAWKEKKNKEREERIQQDIQDIKKGTKARDFTGRDLFVFDPSLFIDADGALALGEYEQTNEIVEEEQDSGAQASGVCAHEPTTGVQQDDTSHTPVTNTHPPICNNENLFVDEDEVDLDDLDDHD